MRQQRKKIKESGTFRGDAERSIQLQPCLPGEGRV
jgi:hypothetical protein